MTIDIVPLESGCVLTLTHEGVLPDYQNRAEAGWSKILGTLATALGESGEPPDGESA